MIAADSHTPVLVFSAHAADFCSRAGGTVALTVRGGTPVHVVDLTFGERGESEDYWAQSGNRGVTGAKAEREAEARAAAEVLGATIEFLDFDDYPLEIGRERLNQLARIIRSRRPRAILTHWHRDPWNLDHEITAGAVARAATMAAVPGFEPEGARVHCPDLFGFEPTVPRNDETGFRPTDYVVIDEVFDHKMQALACLRSQRKLTAMYTQWAEYRAAQARQWSGTPCRYAEAFFRHTARVTRQLV